MILAGLDIETVPDVSLLTKEDLEHAATDDVATLMDLVERLYGKDGFPKTIYHKLTSASIAIYDTVDRQQPLKILEAGSRTGNEEEVLTDIADFFCDLDKSGNLSELTVFTCNGEAFDFPVIRMRALRYAISLKSYWKKDGDFKYDNFVARYQHRHTDLQDVLSGYGLASKPGLDVLARHCGYVGKRKLDKSTKELYLGNQLSELQIYNNQDSLLTLGIGAALLQQKGDIPLRRLEQIQEAVSEALAVNSGED